MESSKLPLVALTTVFKYPQRYQDVVTLCEGTPKCTQVDFILWRAFEYSIQNFQYKTLDELYNRILFYVTIYASEFRDVVFQFIQAVKERTDLTEDYLIRILKQYCIREQVSNISAVSSEEDLWTVYNKLKNIENIRCVAVTEGVDIFANDGRDILKRTLPIAVDCYVIQELFGGLPDNGSLNLFVMPTKAGKTLLSLNLSKACVENNLYVLYMNFEQRIQGDLGYRLYSLISDEPIQTFTRIRALSELPQNIQEKMNASKEKWMQHFTILDAEAINNSQTLIQGVDSINTIIDNLFTKKNKPTPAVVIIDWWQNLWNTYLGLIPSNSKLDPRRLELREFLRLKELALKYDTRVIVFQQMRSALSPTANDIRKLSVMDAADNKGLGLFADSAVVSTKKQQNNTVTFKLDLERNSGTMKIVCARLNGALQRFIPYTLQDEQNIETTEIEDVITTEE